MALFRRKQQASGASRPSTVDADPRIYGRHYTGPSPWVWGLIAAVILGIVVYLAFAKKLPFTSEGYELNAQFANATTLRKTAPVRIAGVNVGKVTNVDGDGDGAKVTFTVDDEGRPIHSDATIEIRPRLFLEGNFFLDLDPGSPSAPELDDGATIPITQTSTAVQIDEVLAALQAPERKGLEKALSGFGTALTYEPTAADDVGQDPDVAGKTGAEALNQALRYGGPAGRDTAIVNEALLGEGPHDLSGLIRAQKILFGKLEGHETELQDLITNFNVFTGALAAESSNLSETIAELAPTLEEARPSLAALSDALPPFRALSIELTKSLQELPATIAAGNPWLAQAKPLLSKSELGGLVKLLRESTPPLAATTVASKQLFSSSEGFSRCVSHNLVPTGDIVIDDNDGNYPFGDGASGFPSGVTNFQEFLSALVNQAGIGQNFDGNGSYLRVNTGGGAVLSSMDYPPGGFRNDVIFGNTQSNVLGTRPTFTSTVPPYRTDVACHKNPIPDVNGTGGAGLPGDVGPAAPAPVQP